MFEPDAAFTSAELDLFADEGVRVFLAGLRGPLMSLLLAGSGTSIGYRLEDHDCRLLRAACSPLIELLVYLAPALPQPRALLSRSAPAKHFAPGLALNLDDGMRIGLKVEPPRRLGRAPIRSLPS
jgi:hypothetical protein